MVRDWYFVGTIDDRNGKPCFNVYNDLINYYVINLKDYVLMYTFESEVDLERYFTAYKININYEQK